MIIPAAFSHAKTPGFQIGLLIALPFLYAFFGFIFTLYGSWVYNKVAKYTGGIEYTSDESLPDQQ